MTPERWGEVERIFAMALDADPEKRQAVVSTACAGDPALEKEVLELLSADESDADSFSCG